MRSLAKLGLLALAALTATASGAAAHTFGAHGAGFAQGLAHPLGGIDHLLAMVAVGLWAAQLGGRALWAVPGAFVAMMVVGGAAGMLGALLPLVEPGIAFSLVVLGILVALAARLPVAISAVLVGLLALFHGHAHGSELPEAASAAPASRRAGSSWRRRCEAPSIALALLFGHAPWTA